eukprot:TRINITY_DN712_c0_g1_i2.p1 TRINITY_DN712_c0_g1~~TRINITY_DN712_c0_g1_i2.p1  ORF type:complete len:114 (+),score=4.46 TRINITY_DN712_c0_g1_i2:447-788(+)
MVPVLEKKQVASPGLLLLFLLFFSLLYLLLSLFFSTLFLHFCFVSLFPSLPLLLFSLVSPSSCAVKTVTRRDSFFAFFKGNKITSIARYKYPFYGVVGGGVPVVRTLITITPC